MPDPSSSDNKLEQTPAIAETVESTRAFARDEVVWMEDGNIIVAAGHGPTLLFKCHRSVLAMNSEVFRDMFTVPASNTMSETLEGLPLVKLPDPADDVRRLIRILYDGSLIPYEIRASDTMQRIAGPLRLATKYIMPALQARLVAILERDWPATYRDWKLVCHLTDARPTSTGRIDPASVIRLARDIGSTSVLPAAFYELYIWYPPGKQLRTSSGLFGTVQIVKDKDDIVQEHLLSAQDLRCLIHGKVKLDAAVVDTLSGFMATWQNPSGCSHVNLGATYGPTRRPVKSQCEETLQKWCNSAASAALGMSLRSPRDILERLDPRKHDTVTLETACSSCRSHFESKLTSQCTAFWSRIPEFFCLKDSSE